MQIFIFLLLKKTYIKPTPQRRRTARGKARKAKIQKQALFRVTLQIHRIPIPEKRIRF